MQGCGQVNGVEAHVLTGPKQLLGCGQTWDEGRTRSPERSLLYHPLYGAKANGGLGQGRETAKPCTDMRVELRRWKWVLSGLVNWKGEFSLSQDGEPMGQ